MAVSSSKTLLGIWNFPTSQPLVPFAGKCFIQQYSLVARLLVQNRIQVIAVIRFQIHSRSGSIALSRILETVVTFHFSGGKVYSMNKGCHTCMMKHTMHVQSLHCSTYLTWLDVCIYVPRSHFHFLKRMLGKGQIRTA